MPRLFIQVHFTLQHSTSKLELFTLLTTIKCHLYESHVVMFDKLLLQIPSYLLVVV